MESQVRGFNLLPILPVTADLILLGVPPTWLSKRKQFLILSKAGKPIYSRHGTAEELSVNLGVMHTIIASYESSSDSLQSFAMGDCTCVVLSRGPVLLIAFSRLDETESQISNQLEALYNQILSTLTLPRLEQIFSNRASTDLRKHLKGTESLLDGLSDSFTRGSPASLLSALECLKLKKTHRHLINNTLLRAKTHSLLYGLIVAQGKLVSVLRPRRHSLHPGDLHLVFNMLFEADGIKKDLDENWIPLCLPAFNPNGFVYAYVGFAYDNSHQRSMGSADLEWEEDVALILISANRDSFFELQKMKRAVVTDLRQNGGLDSIRSAIIEGRPSITKIDPGSLSRHFLYKSRANVQYLASDYNSHFLLPWNRRKLYDLYHQLHGDLHSKHNRSKVLHRTAFECTSLAWMSASFELYLIAESGVSKATLGQSAAKIVQWAQSQEERLFIVGGAVSSCQAITIVTRSRHANRSSDLLGAASSSGCRTIRHYGHPLKFLL